jgi:prolyl-tRNA editing enzyme YbaK/EbsC (Cys-tRNA(Pro) deacylase)
VRDSVLAVVDGFARAGVAVEPRTFGTEVPTAPAAAEALGCHVGAIANSLVFAAGDEAVLVIVSGAHRADLALVAAVLEVPAVRRASPELVVAATGQEIGGVAPCGHPAPLRTVLDTSLRAYPTIWAGGGDHLTMIALTFDDLRRATGGIEATVAVD